MSVNVSPRQLEREDDVEQLARMIEQAQRRSDESQVGNNRAGAT